LLVRLPTTCDDISLLFEAFSDGCVMPNRLIYHRWCETRPHYGFCCGHRDFCVAHRKEREGMVRVSERWWVQREGNNTLHTIHTFVTSCGGGQLLALSMSIA